MAKFKDLESYKHRYAKRVLADWFRTEEAKPNADDCQVAQFHWRKNYGVFEELKFHETDDEYYFECSGGLACDSIGGVIYEPSNNPLLWFDENFNRGKILFVPDVTVFHKGLPRYFFEVVHKHHVSEDKLQRIEAFFTYTTVEVYEIEADFILNRTQVPDIIRCNHVTTSTVDAVEQVDIIALLEEFHKKYKTTQSLRRRISEN